ncbi:MAG: hypothetical protein IKY83_02730 [Proteobacteria bacterium]|nr:hypothetical protein [Pseudomonadota bacterium]
MGILKNSVFRCLSTLAAVCMLAACDDTSEKTTPLEPEQPGPTTPTGPTDPTGPTTPTGPTDPTGPTTPTGPTAPTPLTPEQVDVVTNDICDENMVEICNGQVAHFCNEDGRITNRDCSKLSTASKPLSCQVSVNNFADCVAPCDAATFNEYKTCSGKYVVLHVCESVRGGGAYEFEYTSDPCSELCVNGACAAQGDAVPGSPCGQDFKPHCFGGAKLECIGGTIVSTACTGTAKCAQQFGSSEVVCAEPCNSNDYQNDTYACTTVNGKPALNNRVCRRGETGYFWFEEKDTCERTCSDGVCDITVPTEGAACDSAEPDVCAHNALFYCHMENKTWTAIQCGTGAYQGNPVCRYQNDALADCVFPCDEEGDVFNASCFTRKDTSYLESTTCLRARDGELYYFTYEETCPNGCTSGKCL